MERAANLGSSDTLQAQNNAGAYTVYAIAVDRVTGGRSEPETAPFNLTEADIDDCQDFGLLVRGALSNVNHRINRNTGDSQAVYNGMGKANALVKARPPPFCDLDHPNFGGPGGGNAGGGGQGNQGRRRLMDAHLTVEERNILEGLQTVLETLGVCNLVWENVCVRLCVRALACVCGGEMHGCAGAWTAPELHFLAGLTSHVMP